MSENLLNGGNVLLTHTSYLSIFLHKPIFGLSKFFLQLLHRNIYTEIFTQQFPSSLEALFYLWKREWPGQTITSPHLTSIHTRLYRQTSFDGLETETKWVLWNKLMKHPDFLHVCRGLNFKRSRSISLKYRSFFVGKLSNNIFLKVLVFTWSSF